MNTKQKVFDLLKENKKRELSKKVDLGLIDNFLYDDLSSLEDEVSNLSYLSTDWFEENYEKYRDAFYVLNDVFNFGAGNQVSYFDVQNDEDLLNEIALKAEELGLAPQEVYDQYDEHLRLIKEIEELDKIFQENKDRFERFAP
tara:strand:+ start:1042 stop:1470 length:429 start_codon:yes stop_codon:yes gene_type:complete